MSEKCLGCGHVQLKHIRGRGLCLVASCRLCLVFRADWTDTLDQEGLVAFAEDLRDKTSGVGE